MSAVPNLRAYLTADAARKVDAHGRLVLAEPRAPDDVPIITPQRAKELAAALVHTYERSHALGWSAQRGKPVATANLCVSDRVLGALFAPGRLRRKAERVPVQTAWGQRGKLPPYTRVEVPYREGAPVDYGEATVPGTTTAC